MFASRDSFSYTEEEISEYEREGKRGLQVRRNKPRTNLGILTLASAALQSPSLASSSLFFFAIFDVASASQGLLALSLFFFPACLPLQEIIASRSNRKSCPHRHAHRRMFMERSILADSSAALLGITTLWFGFCGGPFEPPQPPPPPSRSKGTGVFSTRHLRKYVHLPCRQFEQPGHQPFLNPRRGPFPPAKYSSASRAQSHSSRARWPFLSRSPVQRRASVNQLVLINRQQASVIATRRRSWSAAANRTASSQNPHHSPGAPPLPLSVFLRRAWPLDRRLAIRRRENIVHSGVRERARRGPEAGRGLGRGTQRHHRQSGSRRPVLA